MINAPEKQRGGVYGTALQMASCLTNRQIAHWVTPQGPDDARPQFDPAGFVRSTGTLYSPSKEGKGTGGPLVTALTIAVVEAAEELAVHSPGGRLAVPSGCWTRPRMCAAGASCRTSTATTAPAASS